ncbi:beta strand repeat-containing protein [Limnoglobus roseus]|uniref:Tandem repeat protein n=1 Tax=Limnoglobus roseus TaxID=2598579 RepID=A0A5C1A8L4_9BACT|nr:Ig-like domain repeat protein [Limnoglobus roseus]QEL14533.1 tandem repeat protein [Limnoglobus roseus]
MTASRFDRRPRREVRRPTLVGVNGPRLFVESLEDRVTPAFNPNPLFVAGTVPATTGGFGLNTNGAPQSIVVADFNGDGKDDFAGLAATNGTSFNRVDVYLSKTTGTGYTASSIFVGGTAAPASLAAIDVTSDGKAELATLTQSSGFIQVYRLDNSGTFQFLAGLTIDPDSKGVVNTNLGGIVGGDFNNDGKGDFAVALTGSANGNEYFFLYNNGDGKSYTPIAGTRRTGASTTNFTQPIVADFNGDGNVDLAMLNTSTNQVFVLFGDGALGVSFVRILGVGATPTAVAVGDFDNSGTPDLAVGQSNGNVTLFLKDATGTTFTTKANAVTLGGGAKVVGLAAGDYDVDTYDDLAIVSSRTGSGLQNVDVYLGSKDVRLNGMTPADGTPYGPLTATGGAAATLDFDNNGNADFVTGQGTSGGQLYVPYVNQSGVGGETFLTEDTTNTEFGLPVNYNVVIYPPPLGGALPTGSVEFFDVITDSSNNQTFTSLGSNTLTPSLDAEGSSISVTTFQKVDFSVGQHTVIGKYSGDANYPTTTSNNQVVTVAQGTARAVVTTSIPDTKAAPALQATDTRVLPRPVFGQPVPLTVTVTTPSGLFPPGNVSFFDNNNLIGSGTLDAAGMASITVTNFSLGNHAITVQYLGSANFTTATSNGLPISVEKANSTTTIGISRTSVNFGDAVTLSATVGIASPGVGTPTGTVQFFEGTTLVGTSNVMAASGSASFGVAGLAVGKHSFTALYNGNASVAESQSSNTVSVTVVGTASATTLSANPTAGQVGAPVTLTATVTDTQSPPRAVGVGSVTFVGTDANGQAITLGPVTVGTDGKASTSYSSLPLGNSSFRAVFSGTNSIAGSTSAPVPLTTGRSIPTTTSTNSVGSTSAVVGRDVTFSTQFNAVTGLASPVTGTATFLDNGTPIGTVTLANGLASVTVRLTRGLHTITTTYSGDGVYGPTSTSVDFLITNAIDSITVGAGAGGTDIVRIYNPDGSVTKNPLFAFGPDNVSGARVASGDINGDGVQDYVIGTGPGTQARIRVFDGATNTPLFETFPFENFTGGVFVSVGDITGDLRGDIIVTPDQGGGPRVQIIDGKTFGRVADFFGIDDPNFRGGARAGVGDVNGDGANDLVVSAGFGGGPRIAVYDGRALRQGAQVKLVNDFFAFDPSLRNGAFVAVGDVDGDGFGDLVLGAGPGGGPRVIAISGNDLIKFGGAVLTLKANFFSGDINDRGGVPVAVRNLDGDNRADIVTGSGPGGRRVNAYLGASITPSGQPTPSQSFDAFDDNFNPLGGVFVG